MDKIYYTIYKITNQINGKFYIGSHKTKNSNDNYMGSGKYLKHAQEKHGIENFTKEILFVFDTAEQMYAKEAEIVDEEFLAESNTYNLKVGGFGGFDYINQISTPENKSKAGQLGFENQKNFLLREYGVDHLSKLPSVKEKLRERMKQKHPKGSPIYSFKNKQHSIETKNIIGAKNSIHQKGNGNSQFGTRWIHSLILKVSKKIGKEEPLPENWLEGRKIKFD